MAKFRRNHAVKKGGFGKSLVRITFIGVLFIFILFGYIWFQKSDIKITELPNNAHPEAYLPTSSTGTVIQHDFYYLSYNEQYEQAEWVSYKLTRDQVSGKRVSRTDDFRSDSSIPSGSSTPEDYRGSGFDRGHLVPAGDRAFSNKAISETFLMSNISPQNRAFNQGVWRELEENVRDWARKFKSLYIVSGPVFGDNMKAIGHNQVAVPSAYFKVIMDIAHPEQKAIAFLIPNEVSMEPLSKYALSVDSLEEIVGFDFFPGLLAPELEEQLERNLNIDIWPLSKRKFEIRLEKWNKVR